MECASCNYVRRESDTAPEWQCPACKKAYNKTKREEIVYTKQELSQKNKTFRKNEALRKEFENPKYSYPIGFLIIVLVLTFFVFVEPDESSYVYQSLFYFVVFVVVLYHTSRMIKYGLYDGSGDYWGGDGTRNGSPVAFYTSVASGVAIAISTLGYGIYLLAKGFS